MLDLKKIHENPAFVPCSCEKCRDLRKNMLPQHLPMVQTILNTEGDAYSFDYEVKQNQSSQFLAALKELLAKYPKLLVPVLAAVSELFRPAGFPAVYQFATDSVPAKKLINLLVSLFYDRAYEYDSALKEYDTDGIHRHIGNGWEDHHVMLLDTWDLDKTANDELISQLIPFCRKHPGEIHELYPFHVCMTTYDKQFLVTSSDSPYSAYCALFYVSTVYGDDSDLYTDYNRLLQEVKENGYGHIIDASMCRKLLEAGDLAEYSYHTPELELALLEKNPEMHTNSDPAREIYTDTYIYPLLSAAKAAQAVWELDFSMEDVERMLLHSFQFRTENIHDHMFGFEDFKRCLYQNYFHHVEFAIPDIPEEKGCNRVLAKIVIPYRVFYKCAEEAFGQYMDKGTVKECVKQFLDLGEITGRIRISGKGMNKNCILPLRDYDPTADLFD